MSKSRLLIVEDDADISNMLQIFFGSMNFDVDIAPRGSVALEKTRANLPHLIILDIMLPDIDGFEVCRSLRTNIRTSHVPIIFLTQKDERSDKLAGLELGADDYITKPFDIDELRLRVSRAITRSEQQNLTDPQSGLPSGRLIEDHLRRIIRQKNWSLMDVRINNFEAFKEVYGFVAGGDVLRFVAMIINDTLDELGTPNDFVGHAGGDNFIVVTAFASASAIRQKIKNRFAEEVLAHYSFMDREQGYILASGGFTQDGAKKVGLMTLAIGMVSPNEYEFSDIREITEQAADARRRDM